MKYAGGCFGCLTLIFLMLTMVFSFGGTVISQALVEADPNLAATFATLIAPLQAVNGSCCCLSAVLAIVLLAVGSRSNNSESES